MNEDDKRDLSTALNQAMDCHKATAINYDRTTALQDQLNDMNETIEMLSKIILEQQTQLESLITKQ